MQYFPLVSKLDILYNEADTHHMTKLFRKEGIMSQELMSKNEWHKSQAIDLFNNTWDLLDIEERTDEQNFMMIHTAHASLYHWAQIGTSLEMARGQWQISRVYSELGMGEQALLHGQYSLDLCLDNDIKDFDLAFGYEAVARAAFILEDEELCEGYIALAKDAAQGIASEEDKSYFYNQLNTIK